MKILLTLKYNTVWGERLVVAVGGKRYRMEYAPGGVWKRSFGRKVMRPGEKFHFELMRGKELLRKEWGTHVVSEMASWESVTLRCAWLDLQADSPFYSKAFTEVIFRRHACATVSAAGKASGILQAGSRVPAVCNIGFTVPFPCIRPGESLAIAGNGPLGAWDKPLIMDDSRFPWWEAGIEASAPFAFKYVIVDSATGEILYWEDGPDHIVPEIPAPGARLVIGDIIPRFSCKSWKGAGVAVPVFSLRSENSFGVGEFLDLKPLADFAAAAGLHFIQLLPINDTTNSHSWEDSYPYNAISSFALHPMYVNLPAAGLRTGKAYLSEKASLEASRNLDYVKVNELKDKYLRRLFAERGEADMNDPSFQAFVDSNASWLLPYARFCVRRDGNAPEQYYIWVQYVLDSQLKEAVAYAHSKGVAIKGDLPIGVSRDSVDALDHPELFHMDSQAGAPPDAFSADGQNWGFPTYNWERMARDGFSWWKARLGKMAEYFDAYRIDHILGFFRIWEIPLPFKSGLMGHFSPALPYSRRELLALGFDPKGKDREAFLEDPRRKGRWHPRIDGPKNALYEDFFYHRHNAFWKESALGKLPSLVSSTGMLPCGEDLGMIPSCVPETMASLGILSLEIQRMPKGWETFARPETYPYASVAATGTHDMSPLRAWWEENPELTQRYYNEILGLEGKAPSSLEPAVADRILSAHFASSSILTILPLQDYLATDSVLRYDGPPCDERINIPSIPRFYWRYRMHCTLESLVGNREFCAHIRSLIKDNGRDI